MISPSSRGPLTLPPRIGMIRRSPSGVSPTTIGSATSTERSAMWSRLGALTRASSRQIPVFFQHLAGQIERAGDEDARGLRPFPTREILHRGGDVLERAGGKSDARSDRGDFGG